MEPLDDLQADRTIRDFLCSRCRGHLLKFPAPDRRWLVLCHSCREATPGYVRRSESRRSPVARPEAGRSADVILAELGY